MMSKKITAVTCALFIYVSFSPFAMGGEVNHERNPFHKFLGEWKLKDGKFQQVWDGKTVETLSLPKHHTLCKTVNTNKSVLCIVDAGDFNGHILWTYDSDKKRVHHLSHFGESRNGVGSGTLNAKGDLTTRVSFQGEPEGSYRIYEYKWVTPDEYSMYSKQYDKSGKLTGNWYGGSFVRIPTKSNKKMDKSY